MVKKSNLLVDINVIIFNFVLFGQIVVTFKIIDYKMISEPNDYFMFSGPII